MAEHDRLRAENAELKETCGQLAAEVDDLDSEFVNMGQQLDWHQRMMFGRKSERPAARDELDEAGSADSSELEPERELASVVDQGKGKTVLAQNINYMLKPWTEFEAFLHDGRIDMSSNLIEQEMRPWKLGISTSKFVGSLSGLGIACVMRTLIGTCRLNSVNPLKYLTDVIDRITRIPQDRIQELLESQKHEELHDLLQDLLPWNWKPKTDGVDE